MNKLAFLLIMLIVPITLGACKTTVSEDRVVVDTDRNGNGDFCPPGQAKKGNC